MSEEENPDEIKIEWEYDKDYRMVPANGMWGGLTPKGDLHIEFFVEVLPTPGPEATAFFRDAVSGSYNERPKTLEKARIVRKVQVGVMIPHQQIPSFTEWFKDKAQRVNIVQKNPSGEVN